MPAEWVRQRHALELLAQRTHARRPTAQCAAGWALPAVPKLTDDEMLGKHGGSDGGGSHLRFVAISDTHNHHADLQIPDGDVLLHAGDLTYGGSLEEVESFNAWLGTLPHKHKIVVAVRNAYARWCGCLRSSTQTAHLTRPRAFLQGNHDFSLDADVCTAEDWPHLSRNTGGGFDKLDTRADKSVDPYSNAEPYNDSGRLEMHVDRLI